MTLYGFFHNPMVYESSAGLVSLHVSKASAWKACRKAQWDAWMRDRDRQCCGRTETMARKTAARFSPLGPGMS